MLLGKATEAGTEMQSIIESGVIISLSQAKKSTGSYEELGHGLKKMIWA